MLERAYRCGVIKDLVDQARELDMPSYFPEPLQGFKPVYKGKKKGYVEIAKNATHQAFEIDDAR